jgi:putative NADH-flavin reductase
MKIAIIGATGNVGTKLVAEAVSRGHHVTAIARDSSKLTARERVVLKNGDVNAPNELTTLLSGHDVVISSVRFEQLNYDGLTAAVRGARVKRLLVVGGAGSLEVATGVPLVESPQFPAQFKPEAVAGGKVLERLRKEEGLDWTFLSPSAMFLPDGRTGKYRLGKDQLLTNSKGESQVTMADFAIAMVDEIEHPKHVRQRFTVVDAS